MEPKRETYPPPPSLAYTRRRYPGREARAQSLVPGSERSLSALGYDTLSSGRASPKGPTALNARPEYPWGLETGARASGKTPRTGCRWMSRKTKPTGYRHSPASRTPSHPSSASSAWSGKRCLCLRLQRPSATAGNETARTAYDPVNDVRQVCLKARAGPGSSRRGLCRRRSDRTGAGNAPNGWKSGTGDTTCGWEACRRISC